MTAINATQQKKSSQDDLQKKEGQSALVASSDPVAANEQKTQNLTKEERLLQHNKACSVNPDHDGDLSKHLQKWGGSLGSKNRNPGNLDYHNIGWDGELGRGVGGRFSTFSSVFYGTRAMMKNMNTAIVKYKKTSVRALIDRWAPSAENNTIAYINTVSKRSDIKPNDNILTDISKMKDYCFAITKAIGLVEDQIVFKDSCLEAAYNSATGGGSNVGIKKVSDASSSAAPEKVSDKKETGAADSVVDLSIEANQYDFYKTAVESVGSFSSKPMHMNVLGIRGWDYKNHKAIPNVLNAYNDTIAVIWIDEKGQKRYKAFKASVDPGKLTGKNKSSKGAAVMKVGQYQYGNHKHQGKYNAFGGATTKQNRDTNFDGTISAKEAKHVETAAVGLNIHSAGNTNAVGNWSAGCQVIANTQGTASNGDKWLEFKKLMDKRDNTSFQYSLVDGKTLDPSKQPDSQIAANDSSKAPASEDDAQTDQTSNKTASAQDYVIQSGDSLWKIAQSFGIVGGYQALASYNGISTSGTIRPGQVLKIPGIGKQEPVAPAEKKQPESTVPDAVVGTANTATKTDAPKEASKNDAVVENSLLSPKDISSAVAWYKTEAMTASEINNIKNALKLESNGAINENDIQAIAKWQKSKGLFVDGKFGSKSKIAAGLSAKAPQSGSNTNAPKTAKTHQIGSNTPAWCNAQGYIGTKSLDDLNGEFKTKAKEVISAIKSAGASVSITSTYRSAERAAMMRYVYRYSKEGVKDNKALAVLSNHGITVSGDKSAASKATSAFNIVFTPSLTSRHIAGHAVDMNIASGTLKAGTKIQLNGKSVTIVPASAQSKSSAESMRLHKTLQSVGYAGFVKLISDKPHWSNNGG